MEIPARILAQMEHYCAYQERCISEVRAKLDKLPLSLSQKEDIIQWLRQYQYIDENRYTDLYIRSKMTAHQWGKLKIRQGLYLKKISPDIINNHIQAIDENAYRAMMIEVLTKWRKIHPADLDNKAKLLSFFLSKGYTTDEIYQILK